MNKNNVLTKESFDALLLWFSPDREDAGAKYEEIRNGLIRFFNFKGCSEAESLADETINRVARKFSTFDTSNDNKHITYFYGFASKIYLEYRHRTEKRKVEFEQNIHSQGEEIEAFDEVTENRHQCLEECLSKLSPEDQYLMIQYFSKEKQEKLEHRRKLAEEMNLSKTNLHVRVFRIKAVLKDCIGKCLEENNL